MNDAELYAFFIERARKNLHVVICLSPIGEDFRRRLRMFPSIVNCTTIDWFLPWPKEALKSVAEHFLDEIELDNREGIVKICVDMQERVTNTSIRYLQELRRYYYVTPTSYLELIKTFKNLLKKKRTEKNKNIMRYEKGLEQLNIAEDVVKNMKGYLNELRPQLEKKKEETQNMMVNISKQQKDVDEKSKIIEAQKKDAQEKTIEAQKIESECSADLAKVEPIYAAAMDAVEKLKRDDINEVKGIQAPTEGVKSVIKTLCILFKIAPEKQPAMNVKDKPELDYWNPAKKKLLNAKLKDNIVQYDRDNIDIKIIEAVKPVIESPDYSEEVLKNASKAAFGLSKWVRAIVQYDEAAKVIAPKRQKLKEAKAASKEAQDTLKLAEKEFQDVCDEMKKLMDDLDKTKSEKERLEKEYDMCNKRFSRAQSLIDGLGEEGGRWAISKEALKVQTETLLGDILVSSGVIAYLGVFTKPYRDYCVNSWLDLLKECGIKASEGYSLESALGDKVKIR